MSAARKTGACLLVLVLGAMAVVAAIALAWGAVLLIQRGAGTHLDEPAQDQQRDQEFRAGYKPSSATSESADR